MKILIADHHTLVRDSLAKCLSEFPLRATVFQAKSLQETVDILSDNADIDLITLELMMPGMHGIAGIKHLRCISEDIPILIVTGSTRRDDMMGSLQLGASGYISKSAGLSTMIEAAQTLLDGGTIEPDQPEAPEEYSRAPVSSMETPMESEELSCLTRREREVLGHLVRGFSNKEIARELTLEEVTIKIHLHNVYRKMSVSNRTQAVAMAIGMGVTPAVTAQFGSNAVQRQASLQ